MAKIIEGLKYAPTHEWVRVEGGIAVIGVTDFAQKEMGDITYVGAAVEERELVVGAGEVARRKERQRVALAVKRAPAAVLERQRPGIRRVEGVKQSVVVAPLAVVGEPLPVQLSCDAPVVGLTLRGLAAQYRREVRLDRIAAALAELDGKVARPREVAPVLELLDLGRVDPAVVAVGKETV